MQDQPTTKDITRLSGVGESTVSHILNDESGVSERTHERVETVMQQRGFSPSRSARAMRGQSDEAVAVIVTRLDSLSGNLAVQTMLPVFYEQGYDPVIMKSQFFPELAEEHPGMFARHNIDGVVLFGFTGIDEAILAPWRNTLVLMARDTPDFASVCYDDEDAIALLMQRLYDRGYHHISFPSVPHSGVITDERRHLAYLASYEKYRLTPTTALPGLGMKQGCDTVANMLTAETSVLACVTDTPALGASRYLQQQGRAALQLAGVSNTSLMKFLHPEILTVDPGYAESRRRATRQLIKRIAGSVEPRQIVILAALN